MVVMEFEYDDSKKSGGLSEEEFEAVTEKLGGAEAWKKSPATIADLVTKGVNPESILCLVLNHWLLLCRDYRQAFRLWLADCAAHAHHLYAAQNPNDNRLAQAIITLRTEVHSSENKGVYGPLDHEITVILKKAALEDPWEAGMTDIIGWQLDRLGLRMNGVDLEDWPIS